MSRARLASLASVAAIVLLVASGAAHAAWSPADRLSTGRASGTPTLAFDARGWALTTWAQRPGGARRSASRSPSAASFRPDRPAPDLGEEVVESPPPAPVVDGAGRVVAVAQRKLGPACGLATRYALTPRFGRVTGTFAPASGGRVVVYSRTEPPAVALAGNRRGDAILVWRELERDARGRCTTRERVRARVLGPRRGFGAAVTLARSVSTGPIAAAAGARGDMLVAWRRGTSVETRTRNVSGPWGPRRRFAAGHVGAIAAAVEKDGTDHLVWSGWRDAHIPGGERAVGAASRRPHARRFAVATLGRDVWPSALVDRPERRAVRLVPLAHGAIAAWTSWDGSHLGVLTARSSGGRFRAALPATPAGLDYTLGDLAAGPAGRPGLALRSEPTDAPTAPFVAFALRDGSFGAPERVAPGGGAIGGEALAFSPVSGRPTLVWTQTSFQGADTITATFASSR